MIVHRPRLTQRAREICRLKRQDVEPLVIPYQRFEESYRPGECFENVQQHIEVYGGSAVFGWAVWETPGIHTQLEFHSVWLESPHNLVDVTPPLHQGNSITFLPSVEGEVYEGRNKSALYLPWDDSIWCKEFCECARRWQELVYPEGEIQTESYSVTPEIREVMMKQAELFARKPR